MTSCCSGAVGERHGEPAHDAGEVLLPLPVPKAISTAMIASTSASRSISTRSCACCYWVRRAPTAQAADDGALTGAAGLVRLIERACESLAHEPTASSPTPVGTRGARAR